MVSGRCRGCEKHEGIKRAVVYQWSGGKSRRLSNAYCPVCGDKLKQTCVGHLKAARRAEGDPDWVTL